MTMAIRRAAAVAAAVFLCEKIWKREQVKNMGKELFEGLPDILDAGALAETLSISKAGAYQLLSQPDFPTLRVGGRKLVTKQKLAEWMEEHTNRM